MDTGLTSPWSDVAYLGRIAIRDRPALVIAGIHALGSVGAVHYLAGNLTHLNAKSGADGSPWSPAASTMASRSS